MANRSKTIYPISKGAMHQMQGYWDRNNCVVRALANCTDLSYETAHEIFREAGRKNGKGVNVVDFIPIYQRHGMKRLITLGDGNTSSVIQSKFETEHMESMSVQKFIQMDEFKRGVYAVLIRGHIFTYRNGSIIDLGAVKGMTRIAAIMEF